MKNCEEIKRIMEKTAQIPYPQIPNVYPNPRYAQMLLDDFGGELGELSATTQYIYEHINLREEKEISVIMRNIAIMEMKHLDILGEIIKKMGGNPFYTDSNHRAWTAKNVKYHTCDLEETMKYNIMTEDAAILGYRKAIRATNQMGLKRVFERIIIDENSHKEIFRKIIEGLHKEC